MAWWGWLAVVAGAVAASVAAAVAVERATDPARWKNRPDGWRR